MRPLVVSQQRAALFKNSVMVQTLLVIFNLFILEALLSIDNVAVLALLVKGLPKDDQKKALQWGIVGAYALRGASLVLAGLLIKLWPLKILGGAYLCYLYYKHETQKEQDDSYNDRASFKGWIKKTTGLSNLWTTIILVELMDLVFSVDNIFASVALSKRWWVILLGVFIGIACMRLVAQWFIGIIKTYPSLEKSAYAVILCLGCKLIFEATLGQLLFIHWFVDSKAFEVFFSLIMLVIFLTPIARTWISTYNTRD